MAELMESCHLADLPKSAVLFGGRRHLLMPEAAHHLFRHPAIDNIRRCTDHIPVGLSGRVGQETCTCRIGYGNTIPTVENGPPTQSRIFRLDIHLLLALIEDYLSPQGVAVITSSRNIGRPNRSA
jgi:hypothetical protein